MKIGIVDVDGMGRKRSHGGRVYPNLALCKISAYHKDKGDEVAWANPMEHYDVLYMSKVFNFSPDDVYFYNADVIVKGGTGWNIAKTLPDYIDNMQPDLSIYPSLPNDTSYGFLTRGCPNKCPWCVVPVKEGAIRPYKDIDFVANGRHNVVLMDNNILAAGEYCTRQLEKIISRGYRVDFNQALDARLVNEGNAELLANIKWIDRRIRFGCDTDAQIGQCERAMSLIDSYGYKGEYFLYTMIGDPHSSFKKDYERINYWHSKIHDGKTRIYPYAQPYRDPFSKNTPPLHNNNSATLQDGATKEYFTKASHSRPSIQEKASSASNGLIPQWQKDMAQWVNKHQFFCKCDFSDFEPRKGFKCANYLKKT